jgi:hypothetical protein
MHNWDAPPQLMISRRIGLQKIRFYQGEITMPSSDLYWSRNAVKGFDMWFLIVPQKASSDGGGANFLGSVVRDRAGKLFPGGSGLNIIGKSFPILDIAAQPQLILHQIEKLKKTADEQVVLEQNCSGLNIVVEKSDGLRSGVGQFPGMPVALDVDYERMERVSIQLGDGTRRLYIPKGYLNRLKKSVGGDDNQLTSDISVDQETIVDGILLTDRYSVTFESTEAFAAKFEAKVNQINVLNGGKVSFEFDQKSRKQVTVNIDDGSEYLIALQDIDWDDLDD